MPHVTIELSANVAEHHDVDALVSAVHAAALDHGLPPLDGLRTRANIVEHYRVANGDTDLGFVALVARIGPGRDDATKMSFLVALLDAAETSLDDPASTLAIAFSGEVQEIDATFRINRNHVRTRLAERNTD